jgi:hypothetical protein
VGSFGSLALSHGPFKSGRCHKRRNESGCRTIDRKIMGALAASRLLMIGGWAATALMAAAVAVMLIANFAG